MEKNLLKLPNDFPQEMGFSPEQEGIFCALFPGEIAAIYISLVHDRL